MGSEVSLSPLVPMLNSSSSLSLAPEQRGSSSANVHCDPAGLHGTKGSLSHCGTTETLVTLGKQGEHCDTCHVTEPNVHGGTADLLGTKENIVTLRGLMESRGHCDTSGLMEPWRALWHCKGSWNQGTLVTQGRPMEPSVCCDIARLQGTKDPL